MHRSPGKRLARSGLLLLALVLAASARPGAAAEAEPPGPLLLLVVDTLRADHLPCYGYGRPTAPALCALAADGVLFERARTPRTATTPAIASLFTGLYPHRHGVRELYLLLPPAMTTLAERLRAAGYRTGAFVSSFVMIDEFSGLAQGFEIYDDDVRTPEAQRENFERPARETVTRALDWLAAHGPRAFLFIHLIEPHGPYDPNARDRERFALPATGPALPSALPRYQRLPDVTHVNQLVGRYDGEIAGADAQIARVWAFLRARHWYDAATIVALADHGESMGEEGQWFAHGHSVNDAEARVPLIVKLPGGSGVAPGGTRRTEPVSLLDVFPTLLASADLLPPPDTAGLNLRDVAAGAPRRSPPPLTELRLDDGLALVVQGRACSARWKVPQSRLTEDLRLAESADASRWASYSRLVRTVPDHAPSRCVAEIEAAAAPLVADILTHRLDVPVVSRTAVQEPGRKSAFIAARSRPAVPLDEREREALRRLGYLE